MVPDADQWWGAVACLTPGSYPLNSHRHTVHITGVCSPLFVVQLLHKPTAGKSAHLMCGIPGALEPYERCLETCSVQMCRCEAVQPAGNCPQENKLCLHGVTLCRSLKVGCMGPLRQEKHQWKLTHPHLPVHGTHACCP